MRTKEIIADIAERTGMTQKNTRIFLNAFQESLEDTLASGDKFLIRNLFTFYPKDVDAHVKRNPQTGETVEVPGYKKVKVIIGQRVKDYINSEEE